MDASENFTDFINIIWDSTENTNYYNLYRDGFLLSVQSLDNLEYNDLFVEFGNSYEYCIKNQSENLNDEWAMIHFDIVEKLNNVKKEIGEFEKYILEK